MPQIRVFQCPSCGASIGYEGGPEPNVTCQFCGTDVIVPPELREQAPPPQTTSAPSLDPNRLLELERLARSGQKIEAIKLYRQTFNVGLKEAKDAVEKLAAGEPLVMTSVTVSPSSAQTDQATQMAEVVNLLHAGNKIEAIKLYRETLGVGLAEAKNTVEAIEARLAPAATGQARDQTDRLRPDRHWHSGGAVYRRLCAGDGGRPALSPVRLVPAGHGRGPHESRSHRIARPAGRSKLVAHHGQTVMRQLVQRQL
jgi:ribosomal protein L7/L12